MAGEINIQTLFARLRLEQMLAYLPGEGWYDAPESDESRIRFERANGDTPYVLILPQSAQSPRAKRLLQAAIYTLCDVEDRQPAEIIGDILSVKVTNSLGRTASKSRQADYRLRLSNDHAVACVLEVTGRPGECLLMPGESIDLVSIPPDGGRVEIRIVAPPQ